MKYKIITAKKKLPYGYVGMNKPASESRFFNSKGVKFPHSANTIVIWKGLNGKARLNTIRHEKVEAYLMQNKKYTYQKAHQLALKVEKDRNAFSKIKRRFK